MIINGKEVKKLFQLFNKAMQDAGEDNEKAEVYRTAKTILYIYGNIHYSKIARDQLIRNFESGADIRAKLDAKGWQMVDRVMVSNIFQDGTIDRLEQLYLNVFNSDNTPYQAEEKKVIYSQEEYAHNIKIIEKVAEIDKKRKKLVSAHKKIKIQLLGMKRNGKPLFDENTAGALSRSYRLTEFLKILENMIYLKSVTGQYMFTGGQVVFALKSWRSNEEILRLLKFLDDHGMTPRNGARIINTANTESTIMSSVDFFQQLETGQGKNIFTGLRIADIILNLERFVKGIKIVAGLSGTADLKNFNLSGEQRKDILFLFMPFHLR
jgi:hypothetical protein